MKQIKRYNFEWPVLFEKIRKIHKVNTIEELMDKENNFDDKKFLEYLNSKEFQEKCSLKNFNFKDKNI